MLDICYEELDRLKEDIEDDNFQGVKYLDTWDFEDEYSHNHIEENREKFIELANDYFKEENLSFVMREICENAMVCDKSGEIIT
ncbi:hypothetical protein I6E50_01955 [Roseburia hominis]|uniref:hypothetical protein n=1 Tax=Roseburia hominis TaxID=301301 RepID=UPI001F17A651|nr:hypothetical protein [Roseburia hominis]